MPFSTMQYPPLLYNKHWILIFRGHSNCGCKTGRPYDLDFSIASSCKWRLTNMARLRMVCPFIHQLWTLRGLLTMTLNFWPQNGTHVARAVYQMWTFCVISLGLASSDVIVSTKCKIHNSYRYVIRRKRKQQVRNEHKK